MERVLFVDETGQPLGLWHDRVKRFHRLAGHLDQGRDRPVTFPPGHARFATRPLPSASPAGAITMGTVLVAALSASITGVEFPMRMSTLRATSSRARLASRVSRPPASRGSRTKSRPST